MSEFGPTEDTLYHDWNRVGNGGLTFDTPFTLLDETLRDGLQSPSAVDPPLLVKQRLLRLMDELGIQHADIGLPGAGPRAVRDVRALAETIRDEALAIKPACAARTVEDDIRPIIEISAETGVEIEILTFLGSSPIRIYTEGWSVERMMGWVETAVRLGVDAGLPVAFVTEDTTRAAPELLEQLFKTALDAGAQRLILCDTVGHASPDGVRALVDFTRRLIEDHGADVGMDWHGHNDRGLALVNALWALEHGCNRVHGTALGIGERVGNTSMDQLLINLKLLGAEIGDIRALARYCALASRGIRCEIPINYPVFGADAFRTATGVHAAAIIKAMDKGDDWLADRIYSSIPAGVVGRKQIIEVGPMSGEANVIAWLRVMGVAPAPTTIKAIYDLAKASDRTLRDDEILAVVHELTGTPIQA